MKPGDDFPAFVDPLVKRGEALRDIPPEARTIAQQAELESLEALVLAHLNHAKEFPMWLPSAEESAMDLAWEEERSAKEREAFLASIIQKAWAQLEPVIDAALAGAVQAALTKR